MEKERITKGLVLAILAAGVFVTGYFFGRTNLTGAFSVSTQYNVGAVSLDQVADEEEQPEEETQALEDGAGEQEDVGPVNINTAGASELAQLPGIGEVLAQRIVEYRQENGNFIITEDIMEVNGIGESKFEQIQSLITVED